MDRGRNSEGLERGSLGWNTSRGLVKPEEKTHAHMQTHTHTHTHTHKHRPADPSSAAEWPLSTQDEPVGGAVKGKAF